MRTKLFASALLAVIVSLAAPTAAHAAGYAPSGGCTVNPVSVQAGSSVTLNCAPGTFTPAEPLVYTVKGCDQPMATLDGMRGQPLVTKSLQDGASAVVVGIPADATGTCDITGVAASRTVTASITLLPPASVASVSGHAQPLVLAKTGVDAPVLLGGLGALAVLLGGALLMVARGRRSRA